MSEQGLLDAFNEGIKESLKIFENIEKALDTGNRIGRLLSGEPREPGIHYHDNRTTLIDSPFIGNEHVLNQGSFNNHDDE